MVLYREIIMALKNILRSSLRSFKPYVAGKPIETVRREYGFTGRIAKLASNENPLGVSPKALEAIREHLGEMNLYPDDHSHYFRKKLAEYHNCQLENVFAGSGSAEIIEYAALAFLEGGDEVVTSEHTFAIYTLATKKSGARLLKAPMINGAYRYDMKAIAKIVSDKTKIVFLANPTNPTGTWFTADEFDFLMESLPEDVLVFYDSAYESFCTEDNMPDPYRHFNKGRRIAILRTFSKSLGLAGLRAGYALAPEDIIQGLMMVRMPFNMSRLAQYAAMAAMDDREFIEKSRGHVIEEFAFLREGLKDLPVTIPPSQTNFLFIDTQNDAMWLYAELQKKGVIVRPMVNDGYPNAIRVSVGLRDENAKFLDEFSTLVSRSPK